MSNWKTKRRIMHTMKLSEISGVDNPAQEGARVTLMKRAPEVTGDDADQFVKVAFREALDSSLIDRKFCEAFYEAFDGIWAANDAFREALKDRYQNGEETVRQYVDEVARIAASAAAATKGLTKSSGLDSNAAQAAVETAIAQVAKALENDMPKITTVALLKAAIATFAKDGGTDEQIAAIKAAATELGAEAELPATGALAKSADASRIAELEARLAKRDKLDAMTADVRKHYDALGEVEQAAFLALDTGAQTAAVAKANEADPVLYTTKSGVEVRKSAGAATLALAKQADEQAEELAKLRGTTGEAMLKSRVATEFGNLSVAVAMPLLKSAAALGEDTDDGKAVIATLKRMNAAGGNLFKAAGDGGEDEADTATAKAQFDGKVEEIRKRDSVGYAEAMSKAREEFPEIAKAAFPETEVEAA